MKSCVIDIETEGIEPWKDRIICIGARSASEGKAVVFFDEDEETALRKFIAFYERGQFNEIIGYNVSFDLRFIFAKCLKYAIPAKALFGSAFTDVMDNVRAVRKMYSYNKPGKLDDWLQFVFGIGKLEKGNSVKDLYDRREFTRIIQYNKQDVDMTFELWKRIGVVLCR
ncbi:MAG: ribonuclease H-like domain-containing protein [Candidatus Aenigmatarchaeota archaeon]